MRFTNNMLKKDIAVLRLTPPCCTVLSSSLLGKVSEHEDTRPPSHSRSLVKLPFENSTLVQLDCKHALRFCVYVCTISTFLYVAGAPG